jgi:hypothetical protein
MIVVLAIIGGIAVISGLMIGLFFFLVSGLKPGDLP